MLEKRRVARNGVLAKFQFFINDKSTEIFEGITINISSEGFSFLTETVVKEGQTLTITKHSVPDYTDRKARVIWLRKGAHYVTAGAKFESGS
jgi:hypothetical protein